MARHIGLLTLFFGQKLNYGCTDVFHTYSSRTHAVLLLLRPFYTALLAMDAQSGVVTDPGI